MADAATKKKRTFRKFSWRGIDLDQLIDLNTDQFVEMVHCRARRKFVRGIRGKPLGLLKRLRKSKQGLSEGQKPPTVKTHLRNMCIVPEMVGSPLPRNDVIVDMQDEKVRVFKSGPHKCCCSSDNVSDPEGSTEVTCSLIPVDTEIGCKQLRGPGFHSWNNMPYKYSELTNYGRCALHPGVPVPE